MRPPTLTVTIDTQGNATVDVNGVVGPGCVEATRTIEAALGEIQERERKPEYYRRAALGNSVSQRGSL